MRILKMLFYGLIILAALIVLFLFFQGYQSKTGAAAGLSENRLSRCPDKPNCVNSEFADDSGHYIDPIALPAAKADQAAALIRETLVQAGGNIVSDDDNYIAATFTSSIFRFVDDVEIRIDNENQQLHLRSASRVGHGDLGANKKRADLIRQIFLDKVKD